MSTLLLTKKDIRQLLQMPAVIDAVEQAFVDLGQGRAQMPTKAYLVLERGDFRAMPAALPGAAGVKWVNVHPQNPSAGLPTVMALMIYSDPATGYPLAIMDATDITAYRTGAAAAIASKYLAREDSHTLGIVGAGQQAHTQLLAHAQLFKLELIKVFDISRDAIRKLVNAFPEYPIREAPLEEVADSDIVCTVTPVRKPFLKRVWVKPGTHINAIGADAEGKEELEPSLLKAAMVVVDDLRQASIAGEINVPIRKGLFKIEDVYATLSEVITGKKHGRKDRESITIFDSTGIGIEDIAVAKVIYEKARESGDYLTLNIVDADIK